MDSILESIKKLLGISAEYEVFDPDIIMHINSVFFVLNQLGVGPPKGFSIKDKNDTWSSYLPDGSNLEVIKSYIYQKVKLLFDPPTSSAAIESVNRMISELEWRIQVAVDSPPYTEIPDEEIPAISDWDREVKFQNGE